MRTWKPRREHAGNNTEKLRPDQPSSQDARTTVHGRRKPSRAEADARCRQPFSVQAFAAAAPAWRCSWRRTQEDQTRHGGNLDHAKKTVAGSSNASHRHGREAPRESFYTRLFAMMRSLFYAVRKITLPQRRARRGGEQAAQYVDDSGSDMKKNGKSKANCRHKSKANCRQEKNSPNNRDKAPKGAPQSQQASELPGLRGGGSHQTSRISASLIACTTARMNFDLGTRDQITDVCEISIADGCDQTARLRCRSSNCCGHDQSLRNDRYRWWSRQCPKLGRQRSCSLLIRSSTFHS